MITANNTEGVHVLPNNTFLVATPAGDVLVNCPPETLKSLLALGFQPPTIILLPPDVPSGHQVGSSGFVRQGINYASVEFLLYTNFFARGQRTRIIAPTADQAQRLLHILNETISGPRDPADYVGYPWLQAECEAVGYFPPLGRVPYPEDLAEIVSLEQGGGDLGSGTTVQLMGEEFCFFQDGQPSATIPTAITGTPSPLSLAPARPLLRHELTLQFIGSSDGFDPSGITTCFLAYLGGTAGNGATLFDAAAYLRVRLATLGISPHQISEMVLSHLHEDHLAGLPELLLMSERRLRVLTSDIIYAGLLRVLSAILALSESEVASLFDYYPLNPGHPLLLDGRHFAATYAVHSIPTIAVRVNALAYSGDMRYDEGWFDTLVKQGALSPERREQLVQFAEGAEVLVQDAGGGPVHTTVTPEVLEALAAKSQRVILAHTSKQQRMTLASMERPGQVELASSGHIAVSGAALFDSEEARRVETLSACPLFARLPLEERRDLAATMTMTEWADGQVIIQDGEPVNGQTYVVHAGLVEIWSDHQRVLVAGRGSSLGERGVLRGGLRLNTLIARGPVQLLGLGVTEFGLVADRLGLWAAFDRASWLWEQAIFKDLLWATLLDLALDFEPRLLQPGEFVFREGEPSQSCYLFVSGMITLAVQSPPPAQVDLSAPGQIFGGSTVLSNRLRPYSAFAAQASEVWELPGPALQRLHIVYPNILLHLRKVESLRQRAQERAAAEAKAHAEPHRAGQVVIKPTTS
jgi:CRP-like cAMP-binding protein/ribonuclease BN (tRNA processing enzyme)